MFNCSQQEKQYFSAALVQLQVDFVKKQPANVKNLIRLVKYWRKTCVEEQAESRLPTSYPLELITIDRWEEAGSPDSFDMRKGFKAVLQQLVDYRSIYVIWYHNYTREFAQRGIRGMNSTRFVISFVPVIIFFVRGGGCTELVGSI